MIPEPVGSTHLRFGDARVVMGINVQLPNVSESRMRSWTSRGVPEWSGGKDLYMGSLVLVAGKVSRIIGIVPGVPKGVRVSTKGVHLPPGATWAVGVCALAYMGQGHQPQEAHAPRDKGKGES